MQNTQVVNIILIVQQVKPTENKVMTNIKEKIMNNEKDEIMKEIDEANKVSFKIFDDFMEDTRKKYPQHDFSYIAFDMWNLLSTHLCLYNGWTITELKEHLDNVVDDVVSDVKKEDEEQSVGVDTPTQLS